MKNNILEDLLISDSTQLLALELTINDKHYKLQVNPMEKLVHILRDQLKFTGTKKSCEIGRCGSCSVLIDGELANSCLLMAYQVNGKSITTIEGIGNITHDEVQSAFLKEGGFQCGYCTSGMIIAVESLLKKNLNPTEEDIKEALSGNLCRCTGYGGIIRAIQSVATSD
ncbi:(2Fe-2S)-binding protein [Ureibacillus massiliensis]